jgi:cytochrome c oxidase cbb3-type subunit 3
VVCHLAQGQGVVGPNLTDDYWIHGCSIKKIYATIYVGVPEKGMISWKDQLTPEQISQVSSYILTLRGTNPPNPKAPQGDLCQ